MFGSQKIISGKQMTASKYRGTVRDMMKKDGNGIFRTKFDQNKFAKELRADSTARHAGFEKRDLEKFLAGKFNNKKDNLTDAKVKKIARVMGVSEGHVIKYAAQQRREQARTTLQEARAQRVAREQQTRQKCDKVAGVTIGDPVHALPVTQETRAFTHAKAVVQQPYFKVATSVPNQLKPKQTQLLAGRVMLQNSGVAPKQKVHSMDALFGKSEKTLHEAEQAKKLIAKINDPQDYEHADDS